MTAQVQLRGRSGWLALLGFLIIGAALRLALNVLPAYASIFNDGTWEALTTESSEAYHPLWAPVILLEVTFNLAMLGALAYLVYAYFTDNYQFPRILIAILIASLIFVPADAWMTSFIFPGEPMFDRATSIQFWGSLVSAAIWIPYALFSKRVKLTFVEGKPELQRSTA